MHRISNLLLLAACLVASSAASQIPMPPSTACLAGMQTPASGGAEFVMSSRVVPIGESEAEDQANLLLGGAGALGEAQQGATRALSFAWRHRGINHDLTVLIAPVPEGQTRVGVAVGLPPEADTRQRTELSGYVCRFLDSFGPGRVREGGGLSHGELVLGTIADRSGVHRYSFPGRAGEKIVVEAAFLTSQAEERRSRVTLRGPTGVRLEHWQPGIPFELPAGGSYTVQLDQASGADPVTYQLRFNAFDPLPESGPRTVTPGVPVEAELEYRGDEDVLILNLLAGQEVSLEVTALDILPFAQPLAELLPPEGVGRGEPRIPGGAITSATSGEPSELVQAETTGAYRIRIRGGVTGEYVGRYRLNTHVVD